MGRRERKKLQSKQTIMAAAVKKFMLKGVRETSIADIMSEAELGIGTFYNYFESKLIYYIYYNSKFLIDLLL